MMAINKSTMLLAAVCLVGVLAMVRAQNFDPASCADKLRVRAQRYQQSLQEITGKFTSSLQATGSQAMDTSAFQADIDKLTQSITQLSDVSGGFDATRFLTIYMNNLETIGSLMRNSFRMSVFSGSLREYFSFGQQIYTLNTQFLDQSMSDCLPNTRSLVLPN